MKHGNCFKNIHKICRDIRYITSNSSTNCKLWENDNENHMNLKFSERPSWTWQDLCPLMTFDFCESSSRSREQQVPEEPINTRAPEKLST